MNIHQVPRPLVTDYSGYSQPVSAQPKRAPFIQLREVPLPNGHSWSFMALTGASQPVTAINALLVVQPTQPQKEPTVVYEQMARPPLGGHWVVDEPVAGIVDPGETLAEAAIREAKEETGYPVLPDQVHPLAESLIPVAPTVAADTTAFLLMIAEDKSQEAPVMSPTEQLQFKGLGRMPLSVFMDDERFAHWQHEELQKGHLPSLTFLTARTLFLAQQTPANHGQQARQPLTTNERHWMA